jgi:hypothetical protein
MIVSENSIKVDVSTVVANVSVAGCRSLTTDVCVPVSALPEMVSRAKEDIGRQLITHIYNILVSSTLIFYFFEKHIAFRKVEYCKYYFLISLEIVRLIIQC